METPTLPTPAPSPMQQMSAPVMPAAPSASQQSWGVVISIVVIVLMVVIGAFYSWGKRIAEQQALGAPQSQGVQ